jgi:hypothetical protein
LSTLLNGLSTLLNGLSTWHKRWSAILECSTA